LFSPGNMNIGGMAAIFPQASSMSEQLNGC
jgi:hypothetical protein